MKNFVGHGNGKYHPYITLGETAQIAKQKMNT
jgi:hypothetical protein